MAFQDFSDCRDMPAGADARDDIIQPVRKILQNFLRGSRFMNRDIRLIAFAGPATNLVLAVIGAIIFHLIPTPTQVTNIIVMFMALNINLAIFNLLPIPPLDGSKIFFPKTATQPRNYQTTYILLVILIMTGIVGQIISPISQTILHLLLG